MGKKKLPLPEWALVALFCPSCNKEVGFVFADPKQGDEVVLLFKPGDDRRPLRVGNTVFVRLRELSDDQAVEATCDRRHPVRLSGAQIRAQLAKRRARVSAHRR
jgi:hypothetical protein